MFLLSTLPCDDHDDDDDTYWCGKRNECFVNLNCSIKWNRKIRDIFRSFITNLCPFLIFLSKQILIVQFWVTWTDSFLMRRSVKDKLIVLKQNLYKKKHGNYNHVELINLLSTRFEVKDKKKWRGKSFFLKRGKLITRLL